MDDQGFSDPKFLNEGEAGSNSVSAIFAIGTVKERTQTANFWRNELDKMEEIEKSKITGVKRTEIN